MREVVIVSAARTPFGKFGGQLKDFTAVELGTKAVVASLKRINVDPSAVDELYLGVAVLEDDLTIYFGIRATLLRYDEVAR